MKIKASSIPFNTFVQHCSIFVEQKLLQDVEPCVISFIKLMNYGLFFEISFSKYSIKILFLAKCCIFYVQINAQNKINLIKRSFSRNSL